MEAPEAEGASRRAFARELLAAIREETGSPAVDYAEPPALVPSGHETDVYTLALRAGAPELAGPLIARIFSEPCHPHVATLEAAVHDGLGAQGFPVPRVLAARNRPPAFLLMERLPGRGLADGLELQEGVVARLKGLGSAIALSLRLPERVGETTQRLLALDPEPVLDALEARGLPRTSLDFDSHLDRLAAKVEQNALHGLEEGLRWLRDARPPEPERRAVCHGDLAPNLLLDDERVTAVIDWSSESVTVGDPAFEIANTRVMIQVPLPIPAPLRPVSDAYQRMLVRRYTAALGATELPPEQRVRYYEAFRRFKTLVSTSILWRECAEGGAAFPERPNPWSVPEVAVRVAESFRQETGAALELPDPP